MTIVELLVAMGLTAVIALLLLSAAQTQTGLSSQAQQTQYMQDNARAALEEIANQVRTGGKTVTSGFAYDLVAGSTGLTQPYGSGPTWTTVPMISVNNSAAGPDALAIVLPDPSVMWTILDWDPTTRWIPLTGNKVDGTLSVDAVPGWYDATAPNPTLCPTCLGMWIPAGTASPSGKIAPPLNLGDYVLAIDGNFSLSGLYRVLGINAWTDGTTPALKLTSDPVINNPNSNTNLVTGTIVRARMIRYHIDNTILNGLPALVLQDGTPGNSPPSGFPPNLQTALTNMNCANPADPCQVVAEGVEDLQVAVGIDGLNGAADGVLAEVGAAANDDEWVYNFPGETMPAVLAPGVRINQVRISVVIRSNYPEMASGGTDKQGGVLRPALEDHAAQPLAQADGYRRRVLTTRISVRDMATP